MTKSIMNKLIILTTNQVTFTHTHSLFMQTTDYEVLTMLLNIKNTEKNNIVITVKMLTVFYRRQTYRNGNIKKTLFK